jgi:hypothetical protein
MLKTLTTECEWNDREAANEVETCKISSQSMPKEKEQAICQPRNYTVRNQAACERGADRIVLRYGTSYRATFDWYQDGSGSSWGLVLYLQQFRAMGVYQESLEAVYRMVLWTPEYT